MPSGFIERVLWCSVVLEQYNCFALFYFVINARISHVILTLIRYFLIPKSRDLVSHNPGISGLKNGQGSRDPGSRDCNPYLRAVCLFHADRGLKCGRWGEFVYPCSSCWGGACSRGLTSSFSNTPAPAQYYELTAPSIRTSMGIGVVRGCSGRTCNPRAEKKFSGVENL